MKGDRAVVDQLHLHVGTKAPGFHWLMRNSCQFDQAIEQVLAKLGTGCAAETGTHAAGGVGGQGELRDQQQAAADIAQRTVHAAFAVAEDTIAEDAFQHAPDLRFAITALDGDQGEQAGSDLADDFRIDFDARFADALDQRDHRRLPQTATAARCGATVRIMSFP